MLTLVAVVLPALAIPLLLWLAPTAWAMPKLTAPGSWPLQIWFMAAGGVPATIAGLLDWRFHRNGGRRVGRNEHRAELAALTCGVPLFALLTVASVVEAPGPWLVPIVAVALLMAGLIVFDEVRFHRACGRYETALHRLLVGGHAVAFLAWLSWCVDRGAVHG